MQGGGDKQLLTDCQEMLMNLIALNHVPDEVCPDMNDMISRIDDALSAPSTHSSSEMVEVEKVVALVNSFFDNSTTSSNAVAFLVEDIRALTK